MRGGAGASDAPAATGAGLYSHTYYVVDKGLSGAGYDNYEANSAMFRRTFRSRLVRIRRRLGRTGRILDVGCALGYSFSEARDLGWDGIGIEISDHAARLARELNQVDVRVARIVDTQFADAYFDAIVLWDVVEHMEDPVSDLLHLRRWLKPGGVLHLVTPDVGSLSSRLLGARWYHYKPGEHLWYFGHNSIVRLLERAGLVDCAVRSTRSAMNLAYVLDRRADIVQS